MRERYNEDKIKFFRKLWRWWQIPLCGIMMAGARERGPGVFGYTLFTIPGLVIFAIAILFIFLEEFIKYIIGRKVKFIRKINVWLRGIAHNYGFDDIKLRRIDEYRFWYYYGVTSKLAKFEESLELSKNKQEELKKEILIIKISKI